MKVSFPLSLKVSLWLVLNLLLLGALGVGFFVVQGGLGWSALLSGPTGDRAQMKAAGISAEVASASAEARDALLARFGKESHAQFFLYRLDEGRVAGPTTDLPASVATRISLIRPPGRGPGPFGREFGPGGRGGQRGGYGPPEGLKREKDAPPEKEGMRPEPPDEKDRRGGRDLRFNPPDPVRDRENSRFIERAGSPRRFWVVTRVAFPAADEPGRLAPALLVARVDSFWSLLQFLGLESWVLAGAGVLGLSVLFWLPMVRGITRAIGQLTRATEEIAEGNLNARVKTRRRDELGQLGESVNRMATRLDANLTGQKRFLGDVAHELCSPLARLQMATGILEETAPPALRPTVADVRDEVQQMSTLVNELLAFTKAGLAAREVVRLPVDLSTLTRDVVDREDAAGRVRISIAPEIRVLAEPGLLARAIGNLVRNALRYGSEPGTIAVSARREDARVFLTVDDEGPGVAEAALARLGEPFFRPEEARTREGGGVGLGLAIVRNSIAACGGEVRFSNRRPRGFRAELQLTAA